MIWYHRFTFIAWAEWEDADSADTYGPSHYTEASMVAASVADATAMVKRVVGSPPSGRSWSFDLMRVDALTPAEMGASYEQWQEL